MTVLESILTERAGRGHTESWLEREFLAVVDAGGFELPKVQRRVRRRGSFVARVDTIWEPRTIAEVSGFATHSTRRQQTADANRRNRLITEGYRFLEFTYDHVVRQHEHIWETLTAAGIPTRSAASTFN